MLYLFKMHEYVNFLIYLERIIKILSIYSYCHEYIKAMQL